MDTLLRSMLFVPGYGKKYIESAVHKKPDSIILDFEDAVPEVLKNDARKTVSEYIKTGCFHDIPTFIRLNELDSIFLEEDLKCTISMDIDGFLLPKVTSAEDVLRFEEYIDNYEQKNAIPSKHFKLLPMIENAKAILNLENIALASERNIALCFGGEDYLNDIHGVHGTIPHAFDYPRSQIVVAARAAGLQAIDTPYLNFADSKDFMREQTASYEMGFSGMLIVHPSQIDMANECFMPSRHEIDKATSIIQSIEQAKQDGAGIAILNGKMIGPPMEKQARNILHLKELRDQKKES